MTQLALPRNPAKIVAGTLLVVGTSVVVASTFVPWATLFGGVSSSARSHEDAFHLLRLISVPQSDGSATLHFGPFPWHANVGGIMCIGAILMLGSVAIAHKRANHRFNSSWRLLIALAGIVIVAFESLSVRAPQATVDYIGVLGPGRWLALSGAGVGFGGFLIQLLVPSKL